MPKPLKVPQSAGELLSDLESVKAAFEDVNALLGLNVQLAAPQAANGLKPGTSSITGDAPNLSLVLGLQFTRQIADPAAYGGGAAGAAYTQAEITALKNQVAALTTAVALLLGELRKTGQLPG